MESTPIVALPRRRNIGSSRRGILAGLSGGLLEALSLAHQVAETEARKNGKGKNKRKTRKKGKRTPPSLPSSPLGPVTRTDASCAAQPATDFFASNVRLAQTFTALSSGPLVSVQLQLNKDPGSAGDYILQLAPVDNFGTPTNEVVAKTSVANITVPDGISTVTFSFASPFSVMAGTQYALVLIRPAAVNVQWAFLDNDLCAGGAFTNPTLTGPFTPISADADLVFTTFISS